MDVQMLAFLTYARYQQHWEISPKRQKCDQWTENNTINELSQDYQYASNLKVGRTWTFQNQKSDPDAHFTLQFVRCAKFK